MAVDNSFEGPVSSVLSVKALHDADRDMIDSCSKGRHLILIHCLLSNDPERSLSPPEEVIGMADDDIFGSCCS